MRFSGLIGFGLLLAPVLAQNFTQTYVIDQSADFNLVVQSHNKTLDGQLLGACHNGAAHEALCIAGIPTSPSDDFVSFQFNTTRYICTETNSTGTFTIPCGGDPVDPALLSGTITWWLYYNQGSPDAGRVSQAVYLEWYPWSNVALAQISFSEYGSGLGVAFDKKGLMNIVAYLDDRLEPASEYLPTPQPLYRWYICQTQYSGYRYTALTWVFGTNPPQNPTCQKVNVKRVFV
jgi:hypothetical protein